MPMFSLRNLGRGNVGVSLPKEELREDGVLKPDGSIPDDQQARVERLGDRIYVARIPEDGEIPELTESDVVERLVAERLMNMSAFDSLQPAD